MTGPLYDDFIHIQRACQMAQAGYRPLINGLICRMGQDLTRTRLLSLFCLIVSAIIFAQLLPLKRKAHRAWATISLLHPYFLFPFFYASQVSTAMTILWAVGVMALLKMRKWVWLLLVLPLGNYLRVEGIFYFLILWGSVQLMEELPDLKVSRAQVRRFARSFVSPASVLVVYWVMNRVEDQFFSNPNPMRLFSGTSSAQVGFFPKAGHISVQIYAQFQYLREFFTAWWASFFDPWANAWKIYLDPSKQHLIEAAWVAVMAGLVAAIFGIRQRLALRYLLLGLFLFLAACSAVSFFHIFQDWYYLSRATLASLLFMGCIACAADRLRSPLAGMAVAAWMGVSVALTWFLHYRSAPVFYRMEADLRLTSSMPLNFALGTRAEEQGRNEDALHFFHSSYSLIPQESLATSRTAQIYWVNSLFSGYRISKRLDDRDSARSALRELMRSNAYLATVACLEDREWPLQDCLRPERLRAFCEARRLESDSETPLPAPINPRRDAGSLCSSASEAGK